jgi:hypothetical protein
MRLFIENEKDFNLTKTRVGTASEVWLRNCSRFRARDLLFDGRRVGPGVAPLVTVRLEGCSDFLIENCSFKRAKWDWLYMTMNCRNGRIIHCNFDDAWRHGITLIHAHNILIHDCDMTQAGVGGQPWMAGVQIEPGTRDTAVESVSDVRITQSRIHSLGANAVCCPSGFACDRAQVLDCDLTGGVMLHGDGIRVANTTASFVSARGARPRVEGCDVYGGLAPNGMPFPIWVAGGRAMESGNRLLNGGSVKIEQVA